MAGICCGVVGDSEPAAPVDSTTRTSLRRRLDLLPSIKIIADSAVAPPLESCRKRQKRETVVSTLPAPVNLELESNVRSGSKKVGSAVTNLVNNSNSVTEAESCFFSDVPKIGTTSIVVEEETWKTQSRSILHLFNETLRIFISTVSLTAMAALIASNSTCFGL